MANKQQSFLRATAISISIICSVLVLELVAKISKSSDFLEIRRTVACYPKTLISNSCMRRYIAFDRKVYKKGPIPPFEIAANKSVNDIGILSDHNFFGQNQQLADNQQVLLIIGDSLAEGRQVDNRKTVHGLLMGKQISTIKEVAPVIYSISLATLGTSMPDYVGEIRFARQHLNRFHQAMIVIVVSPTDYIDDDSSKDGFYFSEGDIRHRSNARSGSALMRSALKRSALARYLFINIEAHNLISKLSGRSMQLPKDESRMKVKNDRFLNAIEESLPRSFDRKRLLIITTHTESPEVLNAFRDLRKKSQEFNFSTFDLGVPFRNVLKEKKNSLSFQIDRSHWNETAHSIAAEEILRQAHRVLTSS